MAKKKGNSTNRTVITFLVVILLALGGGFLGAKLSGGGGTSATEANGAFLDEIKERGVLRVGVALSPPHTIELEDGTYGGPNVLPLKMLADELNVKFETVPAEWKNIVAGLQAGRYDFAANLDRTLERSVAVQFSEPVWEYPAAIVVKGDSEWTSLEQMIESGQPIGTAQGTAHESAFDRQYPDANTVPTDSFANLLQSLNGNRVIGYVADLPTAISQAQEDESLKIILPDPDIYRGLVAYGVPATADARSLQSVNIAIERALNEGVLQAEYEKVGYLDETQLETSGLLKK